MKSDHRHELKTNVLADWMAHFPEWSKENAKLLMGGTALVVLVVVAYFWSQYNNTVLAQTHRAQFTNNLANLEMVTMQVAQSSAQGDDTSMNLGESSANLGELAQNASSKTMAALAYLKQGEMLREQIQFQNGQATPEAISERVELARTAYKKALEKGEANTTLMSLAQYGLGLCAEEVGQFDEAAKIYQTLLSDATYNGTIGKVSAANRIKTMASFQGVITFPVVEETPVVTLPDIAPNADNSTVTPDAQPQIGPSLPPISASVPAPNAVPADVNASK